MKISATNHKISWFLREDNDGQLDLSPDFQRRPVWTDEQASYLIDTILCKLPFPEIYIRSKSSPAGKTLHAVVDGQQRIRSILRFGRNDLELAGDEVTPRLVGKSFEDLTDSEKEEFWDYEVVVRDLGAAKDGEIRDLFRRLNINSVVLTDQEFRHAKFKGRFIKLMEGLADDEWWSDMRIVNPRQIRRQEDVEYISELFVGLIAGPQDKKKTLDSFYEEFETDMPDSAELAEQFSKTRLLIERVLAPSDIRKWGGKSDFYTLFLAFSGFPEKAVLRAKKALKRRLMSFQAEVSQAKKKDNTKSFDKAVHLYADAITRAATDVSRRTERLKILQSIIHEAL